MHPIISWMGPRCLSGDTKTDTQNRVKNENECILDSDTLVVDLVNLVCVCKLNVSPCANQIYTWLISKPVIRYSKLSLNEWPNKWLDSQGHKTWVTRFQILEDAWMMAVNGRCIRAWSEVGGKVGLNTKKRQVSLKTNQCLLVYRYKRNSSHALLYNIVGVSEYNFLLKQTTPIPIPSSLEVFWKNGWELRSQRQVPAKQEGNRKSWKRTWQNL